MTAQTHRHIKNPEEVSKALEVKIPASIESLEGTNEIKSEINTEKESQAIVAEMDTHQSKRKHKRLTKSLRRSAHKGWREWLVRLTTSARVLSFLALLMIISMWNESIEYSKSNLSLQGSIASIDIGSLTGSDSSSSRAITHTETSDIIVSMGAQGSDLIDLSLSKNAKSVQNLEISIVYDASVRSIGAALTTLPGCQSNNEEIIAGLTKVALSCNKSINISEGEKILSLPIIKKHSTPSTINMVEASFTTKDQKNYKLSTPSLQN